jgi:UDP-N-acetylglucosamine acyltransferase
MTDIHPTAIIEPGAKVDDGVKIVPYCIVGAEASLGDGSQMISHAIVTGRTTIGPRATIFPFASIGHRPQDLKYAGEPSPRFASAPTMQ